jgi:hypothetical protein
MASQGATLDWYYVHIEHTRLTRAINATFRNMLAKEFIYLGRPADCDVYARPNRDGGYAYFFSPGAARHFRSMIAFWEGISVSEPMDARDMEIVIQGDVPDA